MKWVDGRTLPAHELIEQVLIPLARDGLKESGINQGDIDRYMDVIEARVQTRQTGSSWMLKSYNSARAVGSQPEALVALTASTIKLQEGNEPVHTWPLATVKDHGRWSDSHQRVGQFMSRDLFTLNQDESVEFAASLMTWHSLHWIPVEDHDHTFLGLVTHDQVLGAFADQSRDAQDVSALLIEDVMSRDTPSISPETPTIEAVRLMQRSGIACLPVVYDGRLVGIVTEQDILAITRTLLEEALGEQL
jgi:predicted transcriptional regulator